MSRAGERPVRILLVEDDEDDYFLTRRIVQKIKWRDPVLDRVGTYDAALKEIARAGHDVYLFDYQLGERSGLDLLREAAAMGCRAPMILLTGLGDTEFGRRALEAGAADYLVKGKIDERLLEGTLRRALGR